MTLMVAIESGANLHDYAAILVRSLSKFKKVSTEVDTAKPNSLRNSAMPPTFYSDSLAWCRVCVEFVKLLISVYARSDRVLYQIVL